jgi:DNA-binding transcriptional ArsR family regulator
VDNDHERITGRKSNFEDNMSYVIRHGKRIEVETINTGHGPKRKRKAFESRWVKLPRHWISGLARSKSVATYRLAHIILVEAFKRKHVGGKIVLSTKVTGMSRCTKMRAAKELADLGLIEIEQGGREALRVSLILLKE